jgi:hypothetical protein
MAESVDDTAVVYSSHPTARFKLGAFQFENGSLRLTDPAQIEEFDQLLESQPQFIRVRVARSSRAEADSLAAQFMQSRSVAGIDTTANSIEAQTPTDSKPRGLNIGKKD